MASSPIAHGPSERDLRAMHRDLVRAQSEAHTASTPVPILSQPIATDVLDVDRTAHILDVQALLNSPGVTPPCASPDVSRPLPPPNQTAAPTGPTGPSPTTLPVPPSSQTPAAANAPLLEHGPPSSTGAAAGCVQEASVRTEGQLPDASVVAVAGSRPVSPFSLGDSRIPLGRMISAPVLVGDHRTVSAPLSVGEDRLVSASAPLLPGSSVPQGSRVSNVALHTSHAVTSNSGPPLHPYHPHAPPGLPYPFTLPSPQIYQSSLPFHYPTNMHVPRRPSSAPSASPHRSPYRPPLTTAPVPRASSAPATPDAHHYPRDRPASPVSHSSDPPPSLSSRPNDLFDAYPEDAFYLRKPLSLLLNPPAPHLASPHLARLLRELVAAARDHGREPPRSMNEARDWAAEYGPHDLIYEVTRRLTIIFRFCVLTGDLTAEGWSIGPPSGDGVVRDPRDQELRSPSRRGDDSVYGDVAARREPREVGASDQRATRWTTGQDYDLHRTPAIYRDEHPQGESVPVIQFEQDSLPVRPLPVPVSRIEPVRTLPPTSATILENRPLENIAAPAPTPQTPSESVRQAVQLKFVTLEPKCLPPITGFPPEPVQRLTSSLSYVMQNILKRCQHVDMTIQSNGWISGWLDALRNAVNLAVGVEKHAPHRDLLVGLLDQTQIALNDGMPGREAFEAFLSNITLRLKSGAEISLRERLRTFHVPRSTEFDDFCQKLFPLLNEIQLLEGTPERVEPSYVMDCVRRHIRNQYPGKVSDIYPDDKRNKSMPYASTFELKSAISKFLPCAMEAKAPDPSIAPSQAPAQTLDANASSRPRGDGSKKSPKNNDRSVGQVMSVSDPFVCQFDHWPASEEVWPVVCAITNHSLRQPHLPPLWCELSPEERAHLFYHWYGRCLNCAAPGHSLRTCPETFLNESKALNPAIGAAGDPTWREWQQKIQSYRMNRNNRGPNSNYRDSNRGNRHLPRPSTPRPSGQGGRSPPNSTSYTSYIPSSNNANNYTPNYTPYPPPLPTPPANNHGGTPRPSYPPPVAANPPPPIPTLNFQSIPSGPQPGPAPTAPQMRHGPAHPVNNPNGQQPGTSHQG